MLIVHAEFSDVHPVLYVYDHVAVGTYIAQNSRYANRIVVILGHFISVLAVSVLHEDYLLPLDRASSRLLEFIGLKI